MNHPDKFYVGISVAQLFHIPIGKSAAAHVYLFERFHMRQCLTQSSLDLFQREPAAAKIDRFILCADLLSQQHNRVIQNHVGMCGMIIIEQIGICAFSQINAFQIFKIPHPVGFLGGKCTAQSKRLCVGGVFRSGNNGAYHDGAVGKRFIKQPVCIVRNAACRHVEHFQTVEGSIELLCIRVGMLHSKGGDAGIVYLSVYVDAAYQMRIGKVPVKCNAIFGGKLSVRQNDLFEMLAIVKDR